MACYADILAFVRRPPHGGRGLKCLCIGELKNDSRSPSPRRAWIEISYFFERGCKHVWSPSPRRAWIEITETELFVVNVQASPSPRRAWIEIKASASVVTFVKSPSPRRAWIEITIARICDSSSNRRPPHGGRGLKSPAPPLFLSPTPVALPTEGVD